MNGHFFSITKQGLLVLGSWPIENNTKMLYGFRKVFTSAYLTVFVATFWIEAYYIPTSNMIDLLDMLFLANLYTITLVKHLYCFKSLAQKLIRTVSEEEVRLKATEDEGLQDILKKEAKYNDYICRLVFYLALFTLVPYFTFPLFEKFVTRGVNASLPYKAWIPFDEEQHFFAAYFFQIIGAMHIYFGLCSADTLFFGCMIFCTCRCKILQHCLRNIKQSMRNLENDTEEYRRVKYFIQQHKEIIQ